MEMNIINLIDKKRNKYRDKLSKSSRFPQTICLWEFVKPIDLLMYRYTSRMEVVHSAHLN